MKKFLPLTLFVLLAVSAQAGMIIRIPGMFGDLELYCKVKQVNIQNVKVQEASGTVEINGEEVPNMVDTNRNPMAVVLSVYLQKGMHQIGVLELHKEYDPDLAETNPVIQAYDAVKLDPEGKFIFIRDDI